MKKCFFVHCGEAEGVAIVAESRNQAKVAALSYEYFEDVEYIELRSRRIREAGIADLDTGTIIYGIDGLKRGCYDWVEDWCPFHPESRPELVTLRMEDGQILCDCELDS